MAEESGVLASVNERSGLAGSNRFEILLFRLEEGGELFAINVFKVLEVINAPEITRTPGNGRCEHVAGMVSLRGKVIPIINLSHYCGVALGSNDQRIMIVTEFNQQAQGFLVHNVDNIVRLDWSDVKAPPKMLNGGSGLVSSISMVGENLVSILDVECILADVNPVDEDLRGVASQFTEMDLSECTVFYADDSVTARGQVKRLLDAMRVKSISAENGREAWERLLAAASAAEASGKPLSHTMAAIVTDVEMPEMDGYILAKNIRGDARFNDIPVLMHSSLSGDANSDRGKAVGADGYIPKYDAEAFSAALLPAINKYNKRRQSQVNGGVV